VGCFASGAVVGVALVVGGALACGAGRAVDFSNFPYPLGSSVLMAKYELIRPISVNKTITAVGEYSFSPLASNAGFISHVKSTPIPTAFVKASFASFGNCRSMMNFVEIQLSREIFTYNSTRIVIYREIFPTRTISNIQLNQSVGGGCC